MADIQRIEATIGYALAVAAQADDWQARELGPIHLLKYLYLADLGYASKHNGESFTGLNWQFYKFGPWSAEAFQILESATQSVGATRRQFSSKYGEDGVRWGLPHYRLDDYEASLPAQVSMPLARAVRSFGSDTSALLHHVYKTEPMLRARPGDTLSLRVASRAVEKTSSDPAVVLSKTKIKRMREEVKRRLLGKRRPSPAKPDPPPRYDEVFQKGQAWLEEASPTATRGTLTFSDEVWTSRARGDADLS